MRSVAANRQRHNALARGSRTPDLLVRSLRLFRLQPLVVKREINALGGEYFVRIGSVNPLFLQDRQGEYSAAQ
jgi:hypothetical protein